MAANSVFRHSYWDAVNVAVIPGQAVFFVLLARAYGALPTTTLLALLPVLYALALQNSGANHNHHHTPFFRSRRLNALTRMGFSLQGEPKTPHNIYHGHHHSTNRSWDHDSYLRIVGLRAPIRRQLSRFGLSFVEALGLRYFVLLVLLKRWPLERVAALASPADPELGRHVLGRVAQPAALRAATFDLGAWLGFRLLLCAIDWRFFFLYYVPANYLITSLRMGEDFMHHWGAADAFDVRRNAVSCYGKLYNWLTFNLGYHQEHHLRPTAHWLSLPSMTEGLPRDRRIVPFSHYVNVPLFYPRLAAEIARRAASQVGAAEAAASGSASTEVGSGAPGAAAAGHGE